MFNKITKGGKIIKNINKVTAPIKQITKNKIVKPIVLKTETSIPKKVIQADITKSNTVRNVKTPSKQIVKEVNSTPLVPKNFKSEIDWGKWNPEIPNNTKLMQEYNAIEQTSKANGTWMKNPDGSMFLGPREQWIQQQSKNFKKAYPDGFEVTRRGIHSNKLDGEQIAKNYPKGRGIFGGDPKTANSYSKNGRPMANMEDIDGVYHLYYPKTKEAITIDAKGRSWREVPTEGLKGVPNEKTDLANVTRADTDDIATWMELNNKPSVRIKNIFDGVDADYVDIINHKPGNYLKSMFGNNGMFDLNNPNIFKGVAIPIGGAIGYETLNSDNDTNMKNKINTKSKYMVGGRVNNYITDPSDVLT